jgi:thiamine biosynthesis protein ThiS
MPKATKIKIKVNGQDHQTEEGSTLGQLIEELGIPTSGTAVELGGQIVPRSEYAAIRLVEGQSLEIVRLVGGG